MREAQEKEVPEGIKLIKNSEGKDRDKLNLGLPIGR